MSRIFVDEMVPGGDPARIWFVPRPGFGSRLMIWWNPEGGRVAAPEAAQRKADGISRAARPIPPAGGSLPPRLRAGQTGDQAGDSLVVAFQAWL